MLFKEKFLEVSNFIFKTETEHSGCTDAYQVIWLCLVLKKLRQKFKAFEMQKAKLQ